VAFFAALAFATGIAVMVLLAQPPGLVVAIITVVGVGVLLRTFVPLIGLGSCLRATRQGSRRR
jgi:hypothetical protein